MSMNLFNMNHCTTPSDDVFSSIHLFRKDLVLFHMTVVRGTILIQSIIGHTDAHNVHPVQSSVTCGICVTRIKCYSLIT